MITPGFVRMMAGYNTYMNGEVYAAAARLTDAARRENRGAFWGSIHATLSHLVWADQMWMSRFAGWDKPGVTLKQSGDFVADFPAMTAVRPDMDARLEAWATEIDQDWLDQDQVWLSGATHRAMRRPRTVLVAHMFNHQTHHRGQAHAMLTAAGEHTRDTDLWLVAD